MRLEPGARFDRYRIEAQLGEGGMGCVYRAYDEKLRRNVALKVLQVSADASDSSASLGAARLLREARAAAALDHPNAIAIFDVGEAGGPGDEAPVPYIAMELILGRSLRAFVGRKDPDLAERIHWLADVARAVGAAHRRGLVHRDIKPENVMVRDEDGVVKVLDFGIARYTTVAPTATQAQQPGSPLASTQTTGAITGGATVVGTPAYMAPEQMRGETVDGRADQFAWGVLAYELLSGRLPWGGAEDAPLVIVSNILTRDPPALRTSAPEVPANVEATILRALAKSATERFASMEEIVEQLDPRPGRRHSSAPAGAIDDFVSAPTVRSTKTSLARPEQPPPSASVAAARTRRWLSLGAVLVAVSASAAVAELALRRSRTPVATSDAAAPAATATTELDLPLPSTNPEALAAYRDAMHAYHGCDDAVAAARFKRAVELDPSLAPALLRLGRMSLFDEPAAGRQYFHLAIEHRSTLSARDQLLLEAFEPLFEREPADMLESRRRLAALAARFPLDAEVEWELASLDDRLGALDPALEEFDRALALDPGFGPALIGKAGILMSKGDMAGAVAITREFDRVVPGVTTAQELRIFIESLEGHCDDLADEARKTILAEPNSASGYTLSAEALAATGGSIGSVREALVQARARMTDAERASQDNLLLDANLAVLDGTFDEASRQLALREAAVKESAQELDHAAVDGARIKVALETGRDAEAVAIAEDFRTRSRVWSLPPDATDWIRQDERLPILALLVRDKRIPPDELEKARAAAASTMPDPQAPALWFGAYAWPASTPAEATAALDALPRFKPPPPFWGLTGDEFWIGRVYALGGRIDDAIPHLVRETNSCDALDNPFEHVRASLLLGQALESKSDVAGACSAYRTVLARWGTAKPRSRTAEQARARIRALSCQ